MMIGTVWRWRPTKPRLCRLCLISSASWSRCDWTTIISGCPKPYYTHYARLHRLLPTTLMAGVMSRHDSQCCPVAQCGRLLVSAATVRRRRTSLPLCPRLSMHYRQVRALPLVRPSRLHSWIVLICVLILSVIAPAVRRTVIRVCEFLVEVRG